MDSLPTSVTGEERAYSLEVLSETRDHFTATATGISEEQWRFQPATGCWSIAEIVEHVAVVEETIAARVFLALTDGPPPVRSSNAADAFSLSRVTDRSTKFQSPARLVPTGLLHQAEAIRRFETAREKIIDFARKPDGFREHTVNHVLFGPLDGYEWLLTVAMHSVRHVAQIDEVKSHPGYPTATDVTSTAVAAD